MARPVVVLEGEVFSELSLSRVNREIALALLRSDAVELGINAPLAGPYAEVRGAEMDALRARVGGAISRAPDLYIRHRWPPEWTRPAQGRYVHVQPWEYGEIPRAWADAALANVDEMWCYSEYVRAMYVRAGMPAQLLHRLPLGVDPLVFRPDGPRGGPTTRGTFRFLFLGGTIWRKGADIAVNAFLRAFTAADDVALIVKDVGVNTSYRGQTQHETIGALAARADVAELVYTDATLDDAEMAALYRGVDVVVAPFRGEGFGLPMLEAMACGTPVICTAGGAADDFIDNTVGIRIPANRIPVDAGMELVAPGWALDMPVDRLAQVLRAVAGKRDALGALGAVASARVHTDWTWAQSAAVVAARAQASLSP